MATENSDLCPVLRATHFAADKHRTQRRCDAEASPYINHPISLANLLANEAMIVDPVVICAALLHDTIEDTATTFEELEQAFGFDVAAVVREVSDDRSLTKAERKRLQIEHASHISERAKLVKLADKICNLRDIMTTPPVGWSTQRQDEYFMWATLVVDELRGTHAQLEALFDGIVRRWQESQRRR